MDIERILKTRENAIYYGIGEYQKDCFDWVGGNAPACFDDKYLSDKDNLYFYLTFQPFKSQQANIYFHSGI